MCGITARVGTGDAVEELLSGLRNLEYRGYDSAGIATVTPDGLDVIKRSGEIDALCEAVEATSIRGATGIGHTRWSTHGPPTDANAHPHTDCSERVAVVHNGIIDNYSELKDELSSHEFTSDTDTEVVPHLIEELLSAGYSPEQAFRRAVDGLSGSYAIAAVFEGSDAVYGTRSGSPLVLGRSDDGCYLASDVPAFLEYTDEVVYLQDGDVVVMDRDGYEVTDTEGVAVERSVETVDWDPDDAGKGGYDHYMLKEIYEQPTALRQSIRGRSDPLEGRADLEELPDGTFEGIESVHLVAMGTSYHAALYTQALLADRGIPAQAFLSGEYGSNPPPTDDRTLVIAVTQSGETADTLSAVRSIQGTGARTLAVTNVVGSTITRECEDTVYIRAGPEIGVAATKSFSSQVATLILLSERLSHDVVGGTPRATAELLEALSVLPDDVQRVLDESTAEAVAAEYADSDSYFFIGRGVGHPVSMEGALKFKEITYDHAEGFSAAELKHGPLALVTGNTPVFAVFTGRDDTKTLHNVKEIRARGAPVVAVATEGTARIEEYADHVLGIPDTHPDVAGVLANVQLQLVSYLAANELSRPIDKPRNLAKSVTVE
ncbi:glucosamine--fructose-6-phosphate aminotransferase (isomerizing) [Halorubrum aquaticum]|uniref:Glutamine--fructose-6-phosphate aminotransferase [isomerizing] n=1 Tax=Halorubrum aquaticum TaxID=387340 RepID=A0A1I3AE98_9EURY|nr:glutamine--fructose-6-phosphate transaminase (isomerizing) [Halorubrum aquaticum]SFH48039.1 glucosamine--fructose-6-phosphate aminotransferase (isomerizing) [Halorubrum aquaticum]